jgi:6-pyruvoyltetrahydropterin/6-carboxytetrahydropterin synthase
MFSVTLRRTLAARHFIPFLEGPEKEIHVHRYRVEATVMGDHLDKCGFLVNVDLVASSLEGVLERFEGTVLNDIPEFRGATPTMENIARAVWTKLDADIDRSCIQRIKVTIWEAEDICASFEQ